MSKSWHSPKEWNHYVDYMSQWYIRDRMTYNEIAERLTRDDFPTKGRTVKAKLQEWKIQRYTREDEVAILARCLLYHRRQGHSVKFIRWGEDFPVDEIENYLQNHPSTEESSEDLPKYFKLISPIPATAEDDDINSDMIAPPNFPRDSQNMSDPLPAQQHGNGRSRKRARLAIRSSPPQLISNHEPNRAKADEEEDEANDQIDLDENNGRNNFSERERKEIEEAIETLSRNSSPKNQKYAKAVKRLKDVLKASLEDEKESSSFKERTDLGPIHCAAADNNKEIIELLLLHGADINARGGIGFTALHITAVKGHFGVLSFLLLQEGVDIDAVDDQGATALFYACMVSSLDCALLLIQKGANVDAGGIDSRTTLHLACMENGLNRLVEAIVEKTDKLNSQDIRGLTALHWAIRSENEEYVTILLKAGADINVADEDGRTSMHQACFHGSTDLLLNMMQGNVDLAAKGNTDETVLHLLCQRGLCDVAQVVVEKGVEIDPRSRNGTTPLILAAANGHYDTVRMLVRKGANLSAADEDMDTALNMAIRKNHNEIAKFLVENGSPLNPKRHHMKRWRAMMEHDRKAQAVLSMSTTTNALERGSRAQPASPLSRNLGGRMSFSALHKQAMQNIIPELVSRASQAVDATLMQNGFAGSSMIGLESHGAAAMPQFGFGSHSAPSVSHNYNPFANINQPNLLNDPLIAMGLNSNDNLSGELNSSYGNFWNVGQ